MKIIFLHIPKTAGQSLHTALINGFGENAICPARVNDQLRGFSINELNSYKVFSGHLDWAFLDCLKGPKYVFTVLRKPVDRILSFYFYLRNQARSMPLKQLDRPEHQGLKAVLQLSPNDYFLSGAPHFRRFINDHYDNFYTYYFAGRHYESHSHLAGLIKRGTVDQERVLKIAIENLGSIDDVFTVEDLSPAFSVIRQISGKEIMNDENYRVNVNQVNDADSRYNQLLELGASQETLSLIESYCVYDDVIWKLFCSKKN